MVKIAPSILSADFANLEQQIKLIEKGGANWLHLDIMDGHFVPNLTFGPPVVASIKSVTKLPLDAHLMIQFPDRYIENFCKAGTDRITVHVETCQHLHRTIQHIKNFKMAAGVSLNPATPVLSLKEILQDVDQVLVMSVNPGFGGQKFIHSTIKKIRELQLMIELTNKKIEIVVDGGVDEHNASEIVEAGATVLVAGNSIFSKKNIPQAIKHLRNSIKP